MDVRTDHFDREPGRFQGTDDAIADDGADSRNQYGVAPHLLRFYRKCCLMSSMPVANSVGGV
jgi:hypothetical protein